MSLMERHDLASDTTSDARHRRVVALAGGVGGARFLRGLRAALPTADITVIGNIGDDITLHGMRVCPDLDTVMYTLGGGIHEGQGWGRVDETFGVATELAEYGVGPDWFTLGDKDIATHLVRTRMLDAGYPLSAVTEALCARWQPGVTLLPATDERVETHVLIAEGTAEGDDGATSRVAGEATRSSAERFGDAAIPLRTDPASAPVPPAGARLRAVHFQEYWVRLHAPDAYGIIPVGAAGAKPAPGVLAAIADADLIVLPPSNPVVSIGTILAIPGIRDAVVGSSAPVVGVSPIIGGGPVRGMADKVLAALGISTDAGAVARAYGAELLNGWLVDTSDAAIVPAVREAGIACEAVPLLMTDLAATIAMARRLLALAAHLS
jgi:LPPG:FO 2-phospho-L-lactate transferase